MKNFWALIRQDIIHKYQNGDPETWSESQITHFLDNMETELLQLCREDKHKARLCGIQFKEDIAWDLNKKRKWHNIEVSTFRRIFKNKTGGGQNKTQNLFAILLGYRSVADYLKEKGAYEKADATPISQKSALMTLKKKIPPQLAWVALAGWIVYNAATVQGFFSNPLMITGLVLLLFFGIHRLIIRSGLLPPLNQQDGNAVVRLILKYGFYIALAVILSGLLMSTMNVFTSHQKSETAFDVIREKTISDFSDAAFLLRSIEQQAPSSYPRKKDFRESPVEYQDKVKSHFQNYHNELKYSLENYPFSTATYDAHKVNISDQTKAVSLLQVYDYLALSREKLLDLLEQLRLLYTRNYSNQEWTEKSRQKHAFKVNEAKAQFVQAGTTFLPLLDNDIDIHSFSHAFKAAGFSITSKDSKIILKQLFEQAAELYQQKQQLLEAESGLPLLIGSNHPPSDTLPPLDSLFKEIDEMAEKFYEEGSLISAEEFIDKSMPYADRKVDKMIYNTHLKYLRKKEQLPPDSLTDAEWWALMHKPLDAQETDPTNLLILAALSFYESDEEAVKYYLKKALTDQKLSPIQRQFLQRSLERIEKPELYGASIGIMIIKVLPGGALQKAGLQAGDIIYQVNDKELFNHLDLSTELAMQQNGDKHWFKCYRDGKQRKVEVNSGQVLGGQLTQLVAWELVQL